MSKTSTAFLVIGLMILAASKISACAPTPPLYFGIPTYIDPDYRITQWSNESYNRRTMFNMLLGQYATLQRSRPSVEDDSARQESERLEPNAYAAYSRGAAFFNSNQYDSAVAVFTAIMDDSTIAPSGDTDPSHRRHPWVREAACYMAARSYLVWAQEEFDGYWDPRNSVDQTRLLLADSLYLEYAKQYPSGLYVQSARDIRRKIFYLRGDQPRLDNELKRAMLQEFPACDTATPELTVYAGVIEEFECHFRGTVDIAHDSPILVAYAWLGPQLPTEDAIDSLESRQRDFAAYPNLFKYLRALGLYKLGRYEELLQKTPEEPAGNSIVGISQQLLRARALDHLNNYTGAMAAYKLISSVTSMELNIGILALNHGEGISMFDSLSPIVSEKSLNAFATFGLTDRELETGIRNRSIVGYKRHILVEELARRYILSGRYRQFVTLLDSNEISSLAPAKPFAESLTVAPNSIFALVELAEFLYKAYITPTASLKGYRENLWAGYPGTEMSPKCEPCNKIGDRTKQYTAPLVLFRRAVALARRSGQQSESEAKALHYIVFASHSGHWHDQCTWNRADNADPGGNRSHQAFNRLHRLYKDSPWTAATPFWYSY